MDRTTSLEQYRECTATHPDVDAEVDGVHDDDEENVREPDKLTHMLVDGDHFGPVRLVWHGVDDGAQGMWRELGQVELWSVLLCDLIVDTVDLFNFHSSARSRYGSGEAVVRFQGSLVLAFRDEEEGQDEEASAHACVDEIPVLPAYR